MIRRGHLRVAFFACVLAGATAPAVPAWSFDLLGLIGLGGDKPPAPSADSITFTLEVDPGGVSALKQPLQDASSLYRLRNESVPTAESLVRIAESDLPKLVDAMWGAGYYEASAVVEVAGQRLALGREPTAAAIRLADGFRNRGPVPVKITAHPGPLFGMRRIDVIDARTRRFFPPEQLPARVVGLKPGDPAASGAVLSAQERIVDHFRADAHPFAKVNSITPVVDHPARAMDVTFAATPGPTAGIGEIGVSGLETVDPKVVRTFIYTEPGTPYSPEEIAAIRRSLQRLEILSSVRVREGDRLDANGNLPLFVELTERKRHAVGASALYSTLDGPELGAYWLDRNVFGGAETLRLEAKAFYATTLQDRNKSIRDFTIADLGGRVGFSFMKPGLWGTRNDLLTSAYVAREKAADYTVRHAYGDVAIRHRFSDTFFAQAGLRVDRGQTSDLLGQIDYTLVGVPLQVSYDSTDKPLDPSTGIRFVGSVTPYPSFLGSTVGITVTKANVSSYYALDEDNRYILAARAGFGSVVGAGLAEIPANYRLFAGGGGSVRGYKYQSLSPRIGNIPIGGRSLLDGSIEARIKITDTIGIVPFIDAGMAFADSIPDDFGSVRAAAGLGLRYYTPIGPIRLDVATPLNPRRGDKPVSLYISVGQSF
jgi:translocation and assembly module TamA